MQMLEVLRSALLERRDPKRRRARLHGKVFWGWKGSRLASGPLPAGPRRPPVRGTAQHVPTTSVKKPGDHLPRGPKNLGLKKRSVRGLLPSTPAASKRVSPVAPHPCKAPQELPTPPGTRFSRLRSLLFPARCLEWSAGSAAAGGGGKKTDGQRAVPSLGFFGESKMHREMLSVPRAAEANAVQTPGHRKPLGSARAGQETDHSHVPKASTPLDWRR